MASSASSSNNTILQIGQKLHINRRDVVVERYLNQGGFSHLYVVHETDRPQNHLVLKLVLGNEEGNTKIVDTEIDILRSFQSASPNSLVKMIDHTIRPKSNGRKGYECLILLEYCPGGSVIDMLKYYKEVKHASLSERQILAILYDTTSAIATLHANTSPGPIIHRDIKAENILIDRDGRYKLCDFGSCTKEFWHSGSTTRDISLRQIEIEKNTTLVYRSPELCDLYRGYPVTTKVDIWALGIVAHLLIFQKTPFDSQLSILNGQIGKSESIAYSRELEGLMRWMLIKNPELRPNVYQVMEVLCNIAGTPNQLNKQNYPDTSSISFQDFMQGKEPSEPGSTDAGKFSGAGAIMIDPSVSTQGLMPALGSEAGGSIVAMRRGRPSKKGSVSAPSGNQNSNNNYNPFEQAMAIDPINQFPVQQQQQSNSGHQKSSTSFDPFA